MDWLHYVSSGRQTDPITVAVNVQSEMNLQYNILMNVPRHRNLNELTRMIKGEVFWSEHIKFIYFIYVYLFIVIYLFIFPQNMNKLE